VRTDLPVLDAHHHVWNLSVRDQPWLASDPGLAALRRDFDIADLAPLAGSVGVLATVVVQTVTEPGETAELLALAITGPLVAAVVGWVDLASPDVADALGELAGLPGAGALAGIRHPVLTEPDPDWLTRPEVLRGLSTVAAAGLTFDVVLSPDRLPTATAAARALPDLMFVLDHLGNVPVQRTVDERWAAEFRQFAALPNTVCKLSGIFDGPDVARARPYYEIALECFGPGRLMFGSDWPVSTLGAPYGHVVAAARILISDLSQAEQAAILTGTACRIYKIGRNR
jgi:L-fuconolactonase